MPTTFNVCLCHIKRLTTLVCLIFVATGYVRSSSTNVSAPGSSGSSQAAKSTNVTTLTPVPADPCENCSFGMMQTINNFYESDEVEGTPHFCGEFMRAFDCFTSYNCTYNQILHERVVKKCSYVPVDACDTCTNLFVKGNEKVLSQDTGRGTFQYCKEFISPIACARVRDCVMGNPSAKDIQAPAEVSCAKEMKSDCGICHTGVESVLHEFETKDKFKVVGLCGYVNVVLECLRKYACSPVPADKKKRLEQECVGQSIKFGLTVSDAVGKSGNSTTLALLVVTTGLVPWLRV